MIKEVKQGLIVKRKVRGHFCYSGYNNLKEGEVK
jgi:hypothetical protein